MRSLQSLPSCIETWSLSQYIQLPAVPLYYFNPVHSSGSCHGLLWPARKQMMAVRTLSAFLATAQNVRLYFVGGFADSRLVMQSDGARVLLPNKVRSATEETGALRCIADRTATWFLTKSRLCAPRWLFARPKAASVGFLIGEIRRKLVVSQHSSE